MKKTVVALRLRGHNDTADFVHMVTRMWHMLNIGSIHESGRLNDPDRKVFDSVEDERFKYLLDVADVF